MKNLSISAILLFCVATLSFAQEKTTVGILSFTHATDAANAQDVSTIHEAVTNAFVKTKRFNIVDRTKLDAIKKEKELQKSDDFIDGDVIEQGKSAGATFLISGHVISAQAQKMETSEGGVTYKAKLVVSLKVIDVSTGQIITSETIEPKAGSTIGGMMGVGAYSPSIAVAKSIKKIEDKIDDFVNRNFPISFSIVEIQEKDGKGVAKTLLLGGGSGFGLKKGDRLKVVLVSEIEVNGKKMTRKKEIGEIKITKIEDENFSICSINNGGDIIATNFEAKAKLQVITK